MSHVGPGVEQHLVVFGQAAAGQDIRARPERCQSVVQPDDTVLRHARSLPRGAKDMTGISPSSAKVRAVGRRLESMRVCVTLFSRPEYSTCTWQQRMGSGRAAG